MESEYILIEDNPKGKIFSKKLEVMDYAFLYQGADLKKGVLNYSFDENIAKYIEYKDGKKRKTKEKPLISFSLSVKDDNNKEFVFSFIIDMTIKDLAKVSDKPYNINKHIIETAICFWNPYVEGDPYLDVDFEENMFRDTPSFWVAKEENNNYVFKISYNEENIFLWFKIKFTSEG